MTVSTIAIPTDKQTANGLLLKNKVHYQLSPGELIQDTLRIGEGVLNDTGALVINTGEFTGRSPKDKFTVKDETTADSIHWNEFNIPLEPRYFDIIFKKISAYLEKLPEIWIRDCYACADPRYRLNVRV